MGIFLVPGKIIVRGWTYMLKRMH